jgi:TRAP-type C4-dicarboxylate transport system permease small subunit
MNAVSGWLIMACAFLIVGDIFSRELIGTSLGAALELSSYALAICISWGLAHAMSERQHVRIDLVVARCPIAVRQFLYVAALVAMLAWCAFLAYGAVALVIESNDFNATDRSTLNIPLVIPQGLWALGIAGFVVFLTVLLVETTLAVLAGAPRSVEALLGPRTLDEEAAEALEAVSRTKLDDA